MESFFDKLRKLRIEMIALICDKTRNSGNSLLLPAGTKYTHYSESFDKGEDRELVEIYFNDDDSLVFLDEEGYEALSSEIDTDSLVLIADQL